MSLTAGTRIGPYEIVSLLGAGGMGEVYRARDTKLQREVAIKVLPDHLATDRDRLTRFEREAQVLASLNHPYIAAVYGLEESIGVPALVLELVEGPTLADRIAEGPLPLEEALAIAGQIADALEAAHEHGIVHRDLKPSNVKVRPDGTVKVLDFGLAKLTAPGSTASSSSPLSMSPTMTSPALTQAGIILGTAAYMSPEQARGKAVDSRSDIWAFGCVLFEMLTGRRAFQGGDSISDVIADILKNDPDWSALRADVPPRVRTLLRRCLRKDPKKRLPHIGLVRFELEETADDREVANVRAPRRERYVLLSAVGVMVLVAAGAVAWAVRGGNAGPSAPVRFQVPPPEGATLLFGALPTISPDGRLLAFPAAGADGVYRIWLRALDALEARPLDGTEGPGPSLLVWSPDSRQLTFSTYPTLGGDRSNTSGGRFVRRIDVSGGPPQTVCELDGLATPVGGSWNRDGTIIFGDGNGGLRRASATGRGPCLPLTTGGLEQHLFPVFLPDGRHFLYLAAALSADQDSGEGFYDLYVGSLDAQPEDQKLKKVSTTDYGVQYVPSGERGGGRLLFVRERTLFAQAFDPERLELTGEAMPIAEDVGTLYANPYFSASTNGVLAYRTSASNHYQLTWLSRDGRVIGRAGEPIFPRTLAVSPDGTRAAFESFAGSGLFVVDLVRGTTTRLGESFGVGLAWSPDGARIAFSRLGMFQTLASGAGGEEQLSIPPVSSPEFRAPMDWSRDNRFVLYRASSPTVGSDLFAIPLEGDRTPFPVVQTSSVEDAGRLSPDGRFIAYTSNKSGRDEVYVRPFVPPSTRAPRDAGEEWTISKGGSNTMFGWRKDGREVWYRTAEGRVMAVEVSEGPRFGDARLLFQLPAGTVVAATNGDRILAAVPTDASARVPITVVLNWPSLVR